MEVNETRNCLVTDIFLNITKNRLNGFENLSLSCKMSLFPKKVEHPFKYTKLVTVLTGWCQPNDNIS